MTKLLPAPKDGKKRVGRPPKSGVYSGAIVGPLVIEKSEEITRALQVMRGEDYALVESDRVAVGLLARALAHLELIDRYVAVNGFFVADKDGVVGPSPIVVRLYYNALNSAARLCEQLGLTPKSRVALGLGMMQAQGLAEKMQRAVEDDASETDANEV